MRAMRVALVPLALGVKRAALTSPSEDAGQEGSDRLQRPRAPFSVIYSTGS